MDPDAELPHGWTSRRDPSSGRTFYVDHATRETTWQRPVAPAEEDDKDKAGASPPASMSGRFTLERIKSASRLDPTTCSPGRQAFWVSAVFGWVVWIMSVAVSLGDGWIRNTGLVRVGRHEDIDFLCDFYLTYSWCSTFDAFTAVQIVGVIVCSSAAVVISISSCLPRTRGMAYAGGTLFVLYAAFQFAAIGLAVRLRTTFTHAYYARPGVALPGYGVTFRLGVAAACIGFVEGIILLSLAGQAGPGPIHVCRTSPDACGGRVTHQAPGARQIAYPMRAIAPTPVD